MSISSAPLQIASASDGGSGPGILTVTIAPATPGNMLVAAISLFPNTPPSSVASIIGGGEQIVSSSWTRLIAGTGGIKFPQNVNSPAVEIWALPNNVGSNTTVTINVGQSGIEAVITEWSGLSNGAFLLNSSITSGSGNTSASPTTGIIAPTLGSTVLLIAGFGYLNGFSITGGPTNGFSNIPCVLTQLRIGAAYQIVTGVNSTYSTGFTISSSDFYTAQLVAINAFGFIPPDKSIQFFP